MKNTSIDSRHRTVQRSGQTTTYYQSYTSYTEFHAGRRVTTNLQNNTTIGSNGRIVRTIPSDSEASSGIDSCSSADGVYDFSPYGLGLQKNFQVEVTNDLAVHYRHSTMNSAARVNPFQKNCDNTSEQTDVTLGAANPSGYEDQHNDIDERMNRIQSTQLFYNEPFQSSSTRSPPSGLEWTIEPLSSLSPSFVRSPSRSRYRNRYPSSDRKSKSIRSRSTSRSRRSRSLSGGSRRSTSSSRKSRRSRSKTRKPRKSRSKVRKSRRSRSSSRKSRKSRSSSRKSRKSRSSSRKSRKSRSSSRKSRRSTSLSRKSRRSRSSSRKSRRSRSSSRKSRKSRSSSRKSRKSRSSSRKSRKSRSSSRKSRKSRSSSRKSRRSTSLSKKSRKSRSLSRKSRRSRSKSRSVTRSRSRSKRSRSRTFVRRRAPTPFRRRSRSFDGERRQHEMENSNNHGRGPNYRSTDTTQRGRVYRGRNQATTAHSVARHYQPSFHQRPYWKGGHRYSRVYGRGRSYQGPKRPHTSVSDEEPHQLPKIPRTPDVEIIEFDGNERNPEERANREIVPEERPNRGTNAEELNSDAKNSKNYIPLIELTEDDSQGSIEIISCSLSSAAPLLEAQEKMSEPVPQQEREPEPGPQQVRVPEPGPQQARVPEPGPQQARMPEPGPQQARMPEPGPQQARMPEPGPQQAIVPEPGPQQAIVPEPGPQQARVPEPGPQQARVPEAGPQQARVPEPGPQQARVPEPGPQQARVPELEAQVKKREPATRGAQKPEPAAQQTREPELEPQQTIEPELEPQQARVPEPEPEAEEPATEPVDCLELQPAEPVLRVGVKFPRLSLDSLPLTRGPEGLPVHITPTGEIIPYDMTGRRIRIGPTGRFLPLDKKGRLYPHIRISGLPLPIYQTPDGVLRLPNNRPVPFGLADHLPVNIDGNYIIVGSDSKPLTACPHVPSERPNLNDYEPERYREDDLNDLNAEPRDEIVTEEELGEVTTRPGRSFPNMPQLVLEAVFEDVIFSYGENLLHTVRALRTINAKYEIVKFGEDVVITKMRAFLKVLYRTNLPLPKIGRFILPQFSLAQSKHESPLEDKDKEEEDEEVQYIGHSQTQRLRRRRKEVRGNSVRRVRKAQKGWEGIREEQCDAFREELKGTMTIKWQEKVEGRGGLEGRGRVERGGEQGEQGSAERGGGQGEQGSAERGGGQGEQGSAERGGGQGEQGSAERGGGQGGQGRAERGRGQGGQGRAERGAQRKEARETETQGAGQKESQWDEFSEPEAEDETRTESYLGSESESESESEPELDEVLDFRAVIELSFITPPHLRRTAYKPPERIYTPEVMLEYVFETTGRYNIFERTTPFMERVFFVDRGGDIEDIPETAETSVQCDLTSRKISNSARLSSHMARQAAALKAAYTTLFILYERTLEDSSQE